MHVQRTCLMYHAACTLLSFNHSNSRTHSWRFSTFCKMVHLYLVRWTTVKWSTNGVPKLYANYSTTAVSLTSTTLCPPGTAGCFLRGRINGSTIFGRRVIPLAVPNSAGPGRVFIRFLKWGKSLFVQKRFHGWPEIRSWLTWDLRFEISNTHPTSSWSLFDDAILTNHAGHFVVCFGVFERSFALKNVFYLLLEQKLYLIPA